MSETKLFKCMTCQMICPSEANLAQHMAVYHGSRPVQYIKCVEYHVTQNQMNSLQVSYPVFSVAIPSGTIYPVTMLSPSTSDIGRPLQMPDESGKLLAKELPTEHEINPTAREIRRLLQCPHCSIVCSSNEMFINHLKVHAQTTKQDKAKVSSMETQPLVEKASLQPIQDYWKEAFDIIPRPQEQTLTQPGLAVSKMISADMASTRTTAASNKFEGQTGINTMKIYCITPSVPSNATPPPLLQFLASQPFFKADCHSSSYYYFHNGPFSLIL